MNHEPNFGRVTFAYDFLARLVFRNEIKNSQTTYLNKIPSGSRVLIIGGGTGWIIPELFKSTSPSQLVYLEASEKMIQKAKSKSDAVALNKTVFILGTEQNIPALEQFDVILTHFFFDVFPPSEYNRIAQILYSSLKQDGLWTISDFDHRQHKWWKTALVKSMYLFFKLFCNLQTNKLGNTQTFFNEMKMNLEEEHFFYQHMIYARLYKKQSN